MISSEMLESFFGKCFNISFDIASIPISNEISKHLPKTS